MPTFFPTPYLRETLYGAISRFHVWSGNINCKTTLRDLFNTTSVTAGRELPANINLLVNNLPKHCILTVDEIIKNHTLYKYYIVFLPNERAKLVYDLMSNGNGALIFTSLGMCNNTVKIDSSLKYCSFCIERDRIKYGEAYWHLEHQLQGSLMCNKHLSELKTCNKSIDLKNRQEYLNLEMSISHEDKNLISLNDNLIEHQKVFCNNANSIINGNFKSKEMNFFRDYYLEKLIDKGMAQSRMNIYQQDLVKDFKSYYGEEYLTLLGCNFDVDNKFNWVTAITRKHRKSFHPIQHLLMIEYLNIDIEALFNADYIEVKKGRTYLNRTDEEKAVYREKWLNLKNEYPNNSKSFIKDLNIANYTWLNRHDKKWLNENSPLKKTYGHSKNIDWQKRDEEILQEVKEAVEGIYNSGEKPQRVTVGLVGRKINKLYLLQKYLEKMPKSKKYLQNQIESVQEFQNRRVDSIISNFDDNEILKEWQIKRIGGIR